MSVKDVLYSQSNFKDKERSADVMLLFGHGDGGGGPYAPMLEMLSRMQNLQGMPSVETRAPADFFKRMEEHAAPLLKWTGELYFELHRGTYTTQARIKMGNRQCELLLRDVEIFAATLCPLDQYPHRELDKLWKLVLLNQFHDVLPGSCIQEVAQDAHAHHDLVLKEAEALLQSALDHRNQPAGSKRSKSSEDTSNASGTRYHNSLGWKRTERLADGTLVCVPAFSWGYPETEIAATAGVAAIGQTDGNGAFVLESSFIRAVISNETGHLVSLVHKASGRDAIEKGKVGNSFCVFDDVNLFWDAWDAEVFHLEKRRDIVDPNASVRLELVGNDVAIVHLSIKLTENSRLEQKIKLSRESVRLDFETTVHWEENRKFLKVEFPTTVRHTAQATFETQFGHLQRPAHRNTSWDWARFEVCAHRWCDLSEYGFGVALLNDCKYGYAVEENVMRLSLIRSPKAPDDTCDIGVHHFTYSMMPHAGSFQEAGVIEEGYNLNCPLRASTSASPVSPSPAAMFKIDQSAAILETVKLAEGSKSDLVLRLYEAYGSTTRFTLALDTSIAFGSAKVVNILEEPLSAAEAASFDLVVDVKARTISATVTPFKILTLRLFQK